MRLGPGGVSQRAGSGRSPGVTGAAWDGSGLPGSSSSLRGVKAVSTWDLPGSRGQNHGIFGPVPQAQAHRECLGTSPTCPETLRPYSKAVMAGRDPCWAWASCGAEACAGSRFQLGLWEGGLVDSSRYFLSGFPGRPPHVSTSALSAPFQTLPPFSLAGAA